MLKAVIFDMDGLMFDTERLNIEAWMHVGQENGLALTYEIALQTVGASPEDTKRAFSSYLGDLPNFYELRHQRITYVNHVIATQGVPLKKGLLELLDFLEKHAYKVALATSTQRKHALYYLERAGLTDRFDQIICGDMIQNMKPAPDIYVKTCAMLNVEPQACLVLEDSAIGVTAAWQAHANPVLIPDLVQLDDSYVTLLYAKVDSLLDVISLLNDQATPGVMA